MKTTYRLFIVALTLSLTLFTSCVDTNNPAQLAAPEVPPTEIFNIPTEALSSTNTHSGATYKNWTHAGINLLVWNTAIALNVSVPIAAFGRALNERPVFLGNATFEWSYQYVAPPVLGGKTYDVVLTGQYINSLQEVEWVMTTSEVGGYSNFEWYRGVVKTDHTEAHFMVNHQPNNPEPYMSIDHIRNASSTEMSIRYTNIIPGHNGNGGYLEYRVDSANSFNRAFDISGGPNSGALIEIQWVEPTQEGRVKNPAHFNDTDWHCWDVDKKDTNC